MHSRVVCRWAWKSTGRCNFPKCILGKGEMLPSICRVTSEWWRVITQSGHMEANIIKPQVNITLLTKINHAFLFTPSSSSVTRSLITFVCPRQTHVLRIHHTEPRSAFDIPLITSGGKAKTFTLWVREKESERTSWTMQKEHLQNGLIISNRPPQPQMTELWIMRPFWPSRLPQRQVLFPFSHDQRSTPPLEDASIWFASPLLSLAYSSSCTHRGDNRHSVNSWKATGSFRWSHIL